MSIAAVAGSAFVPVVAAAADSVPAAATLVVQGHAELTRAPDLATVALSIVTSDDSAGRALSENNRRFAALGTKLAAQGIAAGDLRSASLQTYANPRPPDAGTRPGGGPYGIIVTRSVQVDVRAPGATGAVIDAATAAGVTQIEGVTFGLRDRAALERDAIAAAVGDASAKAAAIAGAAHMTIVRIANMNEAGTFAMPMPAPMMAMARTAERTAVPTTIAPGTLSVAGSITITYVIR